MDKKAAYISMNNATDINRPAQRYRDLRLKVKRCVKRDKRKWVNDLAEQTQRASEVNNWRTKYQIAKQISGKAFPCNRPIKDIAGRVLSSEEEQIGRWSKHFKCVLNWHRDFEHYSQNRGSHNPRPADLHD